MARVVNLILGTRISNGLFFPGRRKEIQMKRVVVVLVWVLLAAFSLPANAQLSGAVKTETWFYGNSSITSLKLCLDEKLTPKLGLSFFSTVDKSWGQAYAGLTYSFQPWVTVGASVGVEDNANPLRCAMSLNINKGNVSFLSIHEQGGSGYWFRHVLKYNFPNHLSAGVFAQRGKGVGPYIEYTYKQRIAGYAVYTFDKDDQRRVLVGVKLLF